MVVDRLQRIPQASLFRRWEQDRSIVRGSQQRGPHLFPGESSVASDGLVAGSGDASAGDSVEMAGRAEGEVVVEVPDDGGLGVTVIADGGAGVG